MQSNKLNGHYNFIQAILYFNLNLSKKRSFIWNRNIGLLEKSIYKYIIFHILVLSETCRTSEHTLIHDFECSMQNHPKIHLTLLIWAQLLITTKYMCELFSILRTTEIELYRTCVRSKNPRGSVRICGA